MSNPSKKNKIRTQTGARDRAFRGINPLRRAMLVCFADNSRMAGCVKSLASSS